ncbi:MAG: hypothetical protein E5W38_33960, partial [Mesorhizobium sp.]
MSPKATDEGCSSFALTALRPTPLIRLGAAIDPPSPTRGEGKDAPSKQFRHQRGTLQTQSKTIKRPGNKGFGAMAEQIDIIESGKPIAR